MVHYRFNQSRLLVTNSKGAGMDKQVKKHLFFVSKDLNWDSITVDRQLEYTRKYILKTCKQAGKIQDWRRKEYQSPSATPYQMIYSAIEAKALA